MTNTIPHDHHQLRPHHQEMDQHQLQALAVKPQVKKQVRRRNHTSRPYQERLLNMAEARREIVTALKIHRASTSTRQYQHREPPLRQPPFAQQLQQEQEEEQQVQAVAFQGRSQSQAVVDEEASLAHTTTTMSYAAAAAFANPLCNSPLAHWIAAAGRYCSPPVLPCDLSPPELPLPAAAMGRLELEEQYQGGLERLVHSLPARPLGLNLSFQGFGVNVDDGAKDDCGDFSRSLPLTTQPSPAASYSSSYSPPAVETVITHACAHGSQSPVLSATDAENYQKHSVIDAPPAAAALVPVLLDGGTEMMSQQASTGETMGVECSEAAAADVDAWWSKIFESMESGQRACPNAEDVAAAAAGLPAEWRWLCGDGAGLGEQAGAVTGGKPSTDVLGTMMRVDDGDGDYSCCYEGGRSDDVALPSMDGISDDTEEGWNGEWFSCS